MDPHALRRRAMDSDSGGVVAVLVHPNKAVARTLDDRRVAFFFCHKDSTR